MGVLSALKKFFKPSGPVPVAPPQDHEAISAPNQRLEAIGEIRDHQKKEASLIDVPEFSIRAHSTIYLQAWLAPLNGQTIDVKIVHVKDVKTRPKGWEFYGSDECAQIVDMRGALLGTVQTYQMERDGISFGDVMQAIVGRTSTADEGVDLYLLLNERQVEERSRHIDMKSATTITRRAGIEICPDSPTAWFYPTENTWLSGDLPSRSYTFTPTLEIIPPKPGSKAKPHIRINDSGTPIFEASARNGKSYQALSEHIDAPCKGRVVLDYYKTGSDDIFLIIVFDGDAPQRPIAEQRKSEVQADSGREEKLREAV